MAQLLWSAWCTGRRQASHPKPEFLRRSAKYTGGFFWRQARPHRSTFANRFHWRGERYVHQSDQERQNAVRRRGGSRHHSRESHSLRMVERHAAATGVGAWLFWRIDRFAARAVPSHRGDSAGGCCRSRRVCGRVLLRLAPALLVSLVDDGPLPNPGRIGLGGSLSLGAGADRAPVPRTITFDVSLAEAGEEIFA